MPILKSAGVGLLLLTVPALARSQSAQPPVAAVQNVTDRYFGTTLTDPYRWMEQPGPAVDAYLKRQAQYADSALARLPLRAELKTRMQALVASDGVSPAQHVRLLPGDVYLYARTPAGATAPRLYRRQGTTGPETMLLDLATRNTATEHYSFSYLVPSPDQRRIAYALAANGAEKPTVYVLDVASRQTLPDQLENMDWEYARPEWLPDGSGFYYTQMRPLPPGAPATEAQQHKRLRLHRLGTDASQDPILMEAGKAGPVPLAAADTPMLITLTHTPSPYAICMVKHGDAVNVSLYRAPLASLGKPNAPWVKICGQPDEVQNFVVHEDDLYLLTSKGAPRFKVLRTSLAKPSLATAKTAVPSGAALINGMMPAADGLYLSQLRNGFDETWRLPWQAGATPEQIKFTGAPAVYVYTTNHLVPGALLGTDSWTAGGAVYRYQPATRQFTDAGLLPKNAQILAADLEAREVQVRSHDGTLVPLSIVHKRGLALNGQNPTLLTGYGAYGRIMFPGLIPFTLAWFEQGGVYAVAHVRGGGELGEAWHQAGQKLTKPNTWKDFIACAEYLVREKYTAPAHLAGEGTSAGGILIGRAVTERPDLFGAAIMNVGLFDALRFETTPNGIPNIPEFGTVADSAGFRGLRQMSAYHHVRPGTRYPAVLLTTGTNDRRVDPWQSLKMAAALQAATTSAKPVLLHVNYQGGHGSGNSADDFIQSLADKYAFLLAQLK